MFNVGDTLLKLATESGFAGFFANGGWQNLVMIVIACVLLYLGIGKKSALECFDVGMKYPAPIEPVLIGGEDGMKYYSLIDERMTTSFSVRRAELRGGSFKLNRGAAIYVVTEGEGKLTGDGYEKDVKKGDYFFIPVAAKGKFTVSGNADVVECYR